jgi:hypothetical protein
MMTVTILGRFNISLLGIDRKHSPFAAPMTAIASDGANYAAVKTLVDALEAAVKNVVDMTVPVVEIGNNYDDDAATIPTTTNAARSNKIALLCQDNVTKKFLTRTLAGPKTGLALVAGTNLLSLTVNPMLAFKTAYEALALTEDGNTLTLIEARVTGRSLG